MNFYSHEEKVTCPYNKSHRLSKARIHTHVLKCRKSYKEEQKFIPCDFNSAHMIPEVERQYHDQVCPDRKNIEAPVYQSLASTNSVGAPIPSITIETEENWDDLDLPTYDPQKYAANANVIRNPSGKKPAERKEFYIQERERLGQLANNPNPNINVSKIVKLPQHRPVPDSN